MSSDAWLTALLADTIVLPWADTIALFYIEKDGAAKKFLCAFLLKQIYKPKLSSEKVLSKIVQYMEFIFVPV